MKHHECSTTVVDLPVEALSANFALHSISVCAVVAAAALLSTCQRSVAIDESNIVACTYAFLAKKHPAVDGHERLVGTGLGTTVKADTMTHKKHHAHVVITYRTLFPQAKHRAHLREITMTVEVIQVRLLLVHKF